jgi:hypothetical protein
MMLKSVAVQKESTLKPATKWSQRRIIRALMTSKNKPRVKNVTGKVNKTKTGFTKKLRSANTMATVSAVVNSSTTTPFIKCAMINTSSAVINILIKIFIGIILKIGWFLQKRL